MKTHVMVDWDLRKVLIQEVENKISPQLILSVKYGGITIKGKDMLVIIPDDRTATIVVSPVDKHGHPSQIEGLNYSSSDETVATVDQSGIITPVAVGIATINVTADAVIGEGESIIAGLLEIQVVASQAVSFDLTATLNAA